MRIGKGNLANFEADFWLWDTVFFHAPGKFNGMECDKPDSVPERKLERVMIIYLVTALPRDSSDQPEHWAGRLITCPA